MACFHPLTGVIYGTNLGTGKKALFVSKKGYANLDDPNVIPIPCGHCIGCRLDYSRRWADRMMLELDHTGKAIFLTLTYSDHYVPHSPKTGFQTLVKRDWQLFMKSFRERFRPKTLRFYMSGEYGEHTLRPHYHAIIFGIDLDDFDDLVVQEKNDFGQILWSSKFIEDVWQKGICRIGSVSWQTCAYVSRYVTKKLSGDEASYYALADIEPEFSLMSRRPGIAGFYLDDHPEALEYQFISVRDTDGVTCKNQVFRPDYLVNKIELTNPFLYDTIKFSKSDHAKDSDILEFQNTSLTDYKRYLEVKENNMKARVASLKRDGDF